MREVIWDTETTGLNPETGDRLVEIGAVELHQHIPTGRTYHQYINPQRNMPKSAFNIHGLSIDFLKDFPIFAEIAKDFLEFIDDAVLIAHNATFDMKFINYELKLANFPIITSDRVLDTLEIAKNKFPGAKNSLDALCRRYQIDNSLREKHGALLDSEILAEVYLELIGGRQPDFELNSITKDMEINIIKKTNNKIHSRPNILPSLLTKEEEENHKKFITLLGENSLWENK